MSDRWLRLNTAWDETEWVMMLQPLSQLGWIKLLCYVKDRGTKGSVKAMTQVAAAKRWGIPVRAVSDMLHAAKRGEAMVGVDGKWILLNWDKYQEPDATAAQRKRDQRARLNGHGVTDGHSMSHRDRV